MAQFLRYWYIRGPEHIWRVFLSVIGGFENSLAVRDTARNLDKPLFQDYTRSGRAVGFLIRLARILIGLVIYLLIASLFALFSVIWVLFPAICLVSLVGSVFGNDTAAFPCLYDCLK